MCMDAPVDTRPLVIAGHAAEASTTPAVGMHSCTGRPAAAAASANPRKKRDSPPASPASPGVGSRWSLRKSVSYAAKVGAIVLKASKSPA